MLRTSDTTRTSGTTNPRASAARLPPQVFLRSRGIEAALDSRVLSVEWVKSFTA
jgi:hypothetical protein